MFIETREFPKIRLYRFTRHRRKASCWEYHCSTILFASREAARHEYAERAGIPVADVRAEFAATHGHYIED